MSKGIKQLKSLPLHEDFARRPRSITPLLALFFFIWIYIYWFHPNNDGLNMHVNRPDVAQNIVGPYQTELRQFKISRIVIADDCIQPNLDDEWTATCALVTRQGATEKVGIGVVGSQPLAFWLEMDSSGTLTVRMSQQSDDPKADALMISHELDGVLKSVREELPSD